MKRLILTTSASVLMLSMPISLSLTPLVTSVNAFPLNSTLISENNSVKSGTFQSAEHPTSGTVTIIEENGEYFIELSEDFKTDDGPDLQVILHRSEDVIGSTKAPTHSIAEGDYVIIAPLESKQGTQRYAIPKNVSLDDYASVAIWCQQFNATFGAAALGN
jgi:hypothetical protein